MTPLAGAKGHQALLSSSAGTHFVYHNKMAVCNDALDFLFPLVLREARASGPYIIDSALCRSRIYLYWHPVALKMEINDIANFLGSTVLACHHDVQQPASRLYLQCLTHPTGQAE